nr:MAG TPA: Protein HEXIM1 T-binding domain (TBD), Cyclin.1A [Caudoviricetes sp.]
MKEKVFSDWYHQTRDITARAGFDAAWQHQQAKVDELQKRVDEMQRISNEEDIAISKLHNYIAKLLEENKELKAENKKIGQALKGEG